MEFEKIRSIIAEQLSIDESKITEKTTFIEDLGADSLDLFQIISEIEDAFELEFTNEAAERVKTVGDAVAYIRLLSE